VPDTNDVLAAIEDTLANWTGSVDSSTWTASGLPQLTRQDQVVARYLCARTGVDGYTAWLMVADVTLWGTSSPFAADVAAAWDEVQADVARCVLAVLQPAIVVVVEQARAAAAAIAPVIIGAMNSVTEVLTRTVAPIMTAIFRSVAPLLVAAAHEDDVAKRPRWHVRRCAKCNPRCANTEPWAYGREYNRRRKARARRRRR
jgi:hypothetical protein